MADINQAVLVGRLTRDAEVKVTQGGMQITKFALAVNRRRKQGDEWVDEAHFFDCVIFGRMGEAISRYLTKGKQVGVAGQLTQDRWEQDGHKRSRVQIVADNVQLLGSKGDDSGPSKAAPSAHDDFEDDLPPF